MHKSATKCNKTVGKWYKNKHGALKIIDTLETYQPLGRKQHSYIQGHMLCLHYTLCLMQLSVVRNLILMGCSDHIPVSGLLVIDAVRWRSMYFVVMPRVNLIVIFSTYARYIYSINCPTVNCLPSILLFILWRDTTSELWTPVQFSLHCYHLLTITCIVYFLAYYYCFPLDTLIHLFTANR
jgi:hypothetical protein